MVIVCTDPKPIQATTAKMASVAATPMELIIGRINAVTHAMAAARNALVFSGVISLLIFESRA